jgi:drug/metabolite transporter (DMT)-like permease
MTASLVRVARSCEPRSENWSRYWAVRGVAFMPRRLQDLVVFAAPGVFVVLWATGTIGAKFGLAYAEPLTFLALRMGTVVVLLGAILSLTRPKWPGARGASHSVVTGLMVHGLGLGGVFVSIENGLSAGMVALVLSLQPALTSTMANRWLGERVRLLQWVGLALGMLGIYLIVRDRATTGSATPFAWVASAVGLFGITVGTLYQKRFGGEIDWRPALCVQYAAAGLLFAFGAAVFETGVVDWTPQFLFALGWLVLVLSFGAVWLLYFLIRRVPVTRVASLFYLTPPVTALMAWALFNERLAPPALLGMTVCVLGVFLVNWKSKEI